MQLSPTVAKRSALFLRPAQFLALCVALAAGPAACDRDSAQTSGPAQGTRDSAANEGGSAKVQAAPAAVKADSGAAKLAAKPARKALVAGDIEYVELILGGAAPEDPLPMIVAIHGLGDNPEHFANLLQGYPERARLILPRGVDPTEDGGWSWFPNRARDPDVESLAAGIKRSADRLAVALARLQTQRPTLGKPIVTGFSQGGMLVFTLAVHHPEVVGHAVAVGGWLPPPLWPQTKDDKDYPSLLALHGTADNAVLYPPTLAAVEHLKQLGFDATLKSYPGVRHAITAEIHRDLSDALVDANLAARRSAKAKKKP